jgi:nicotinamide N-methyltransferase
VLSFLARHYPAIKSQPCAIEIGCGPTVHHVLSLAPFVSEIHMADYLPDNLDQVRRWRNGMPDAHHWHDYTAFALSLEGRESTQAEIERRETDTRRKITRLLHCDLTSDQPLPAEQDYAVVTSFYCAENIGITHDEWFKALRRLASLTAPRGYLFLSALRETHFYVVESADGRRQRLPSAYLTEEHFRDALPALGFDMRRSAIESTSLKGQEEAGVKGVILVAALKA